MVSVDRFDKENFVKIVKKNGFKNAKKVFKNTEISNDGMIILI